MTTDTKTNGQSIRGTARQAAIAAQAKRRAQSFERDKRLDAVTRRPRWNGPGVLRG